MNDTRDKLLLSAPGDSPFSQSRIIAGNAPSSRMNLILKNIETLFDMQREDGSWESPSMLQFPLPPNTKPWNDPRRIREDLYDQKRIFTTSTCLMGLSSLRELNI